MGRTYRNTVGLCRLRSPLPGAARGGGGKWAECWLQGPWGGGRHLPCGQMPGSYSRALWQLRRLRPGREGGVTKSRAGLESKADALAARQVYLDRRAHSGEAR